MDWRHVRDSSLHARTRECSNCILRTWPKYPRFRSAVIRNRMWRAVVLPFLPLAGTTSTPDIAANGEDLCLSVFTFMPPFTRTIVCLNRSAQRLINLELLSSLCPWISPVLWSSMAMAVVKLLSAGTMTWAVSACNAAVVMFRMRSLCLCAMMVQCRLSVWDSFWSLHAPFLLLALHVERSTLPPSVRVTRYLFLPSRITLMVPSNRQWCS